MSQSLRERIEGLRRFSPASSGRMADKDDGRWIVRSDVLRIVAEHEREQAAVAMGVRPSGTMMRLVRVPAPPMLSLNPDDFEFDEDDDESKCSGCGGVVWLKPDGTGAVSDV